MTIRPIQRDAGLRDRGVEAPIAFAVARLSERMFTVALGATVTISAYTLASSPLRPDGAELRSYLAGVSLLTGSVLAFHGRAYLLRIVRRHPGLVLLWTLAGLTVLWIDSSPASTYFILPMSGIAIAAVLGYTA